MQFQAYQRGSVERILANYYILHNGWYGSTANSYLTGLRGPNLRGCIVSAVRTTTLQALSPVYGAGVTLGGTSIAQEVQYLDCAQDVPLGVLDSKMVMGVDALVNTWVTVCVYGWMDRINCGNTILSNHDYLVMQRDGEVATFGTSNRGLAIGYGRPGAIASRKLTGVCQLTLPNPPIAGDIFIRLDGGAASGAPGNTSWTTPPGKDNQALLDSTGTVSVPMADAPVIAMRTSKAPQTPTETVTGGTGIPAFVEGFLFMLGLSKNVG